MKKHLLSISALAAAVFAAFTVVASSDTSKEAIKQKRMEEILRNLPDSVFETVKLEDLLDDEVYLKLARDGWSSREITTIMETAVKDKKTARMRGSYGAYAKEWRPVYGRMMSEDPLYQVRDSALTPKDIASIYEAVGENNYNATWEVIPYDPAARKAPGYQRNPGYFKNVRLNPSSGRTHWIVVNQKNDAGDELYAVVDGGGIFSTHNCGKTWKCITDNIPERANRSQSPGYSIPVDPDNWNHLFAFMDNSSVYETEDGGESWTRVANATHKTFKRGYCFRDNAGNLKLIGADMQSNRLNNKLWISDNKGVTWRQITPPDNFLETVDGTKGFWFQQMAFDPDNRDIVYFPGSHSILYFDDGGVSGQLKRMQFTVYGATKDEVRAANTTSFPFDSNGPGFLEIDPNNHNRMWYAVGNKTNNYTALYFSDDRGKTWITLNEPHVLKNGVYTTEGGYGSGALFGNESPGPWLGGFGVRYDAKNPDQVPTTLFACTMSSAYSNDGGRNWTEYAWGTRQVSYISENVPHLSAGPGLYYVSASRHNADNHCIASHKSGRVFRGGDGGFFLNDPTVSGRVRYENNSTNTSTLTDHDWINISSDLGQMLFYNVRVNEFGDQAIIGNTQDIDVQTYRYGRWGHWRGYEGTEASFNPYTGTGYFSGGGGEGPEGMKADSWHSARNYADVCTGSWFMLRTWNGGGPSTLFRVDDVGRSLTDLYNVIGKTVTDVGLCRKDKDGNDKLTVFIRTSGDNAFWVSNDSCKTFEPLYSSTNARVAFASTVMAVDPEHPEFFYFARAGGQVYKYSLETRNWTAVGTGIPTSAKCNRLLFHEGSGDLYYVDYSSGIYILKNGETQWRFWTRGYNNSKLGDCDINYTTQEFVLSDYGRGVWVADLETPSDRYFRNGFKLKEYSHRDGRRTFGIDTKWTIPMYYNFQWYVNDQPLENYNYQYLTIDEDVPMVVELELSLREAPDVKTLSSPFSVSRRGETATENVPLERRQGNALYSNGEGRVDIGYMDWFDGDFSVDLWLKPMSDGVILANTQKSVEKGAKGWLLYIENGVLKFKYYPSNYMQQPTYEAGINQKPVVTGSAIPLNTWSHVALVQQRKGNIIMYINGQQVISTERIRRDEEHGLNNSVIMSLFGDAFESSTLKGCVDELKFWNVALSASDVRREMFSTGLATKGLMAHYDFNGDRLEDNLETFTGYSPKNRQRAVTSAQRMTVPVSANYVADADLNGNNTFVASNDNKVTMMTIKGENLNGIHAFVYGYDATRWEDPDDNLSETYFAHSDYGYMLRTFGGSADGAKADIQFHNGDTNFDSNANYRLYMADNADDRMYWKRYEGDLVHDGGTLKLTGVNLKDIENRKLLIVSMKPAIEMTLDGLASDGRVIIYDDADDAPDFPFTAKLIEGMTLDKNSYKIMSDSTVLMVPEYPLTFNDRGEAHGNIQVDLDLIGPFNNTISTYVRGADDEFMIPVPIDVCNRISPKTLENSVQIAGGGMKVGTAADFATLKGGRNLTLMGWVRIDSETMMEKGRNNDGVSPLLFFRTSPDNTGTTGIHLRAHKTGNVFDGAMLGYHWNDQSWNYNATTPFIIPKEDLGKWNHVALVVTPEGAWMYFNGMEYKMTGIPSGGMPACTVQSPLLVGMNVQGGNTYFNGAFDHVAVWDRSLTREEIHKYMHNRVLLNDDNLLAYLTMDEKDEKGLIKESLKGMSSVYYGTVNPGPSTPVPFAPYRQDMSMSTPDCPIHLSPAAQGCVASFGGTPYNYVNVGSEEQAYLPLSHEYYTVIFNSKPTTTGNITLTYTNEGIQAGEGIAVATRPIGSVTPFTSYQLATSVEEGSATFTLPASMLAESSEVMFFSTPGSNHRPNIVHVAFANPGVEDGGIHLFGSGESTLDVNINVVSGSDTGARIQVLETDYVSFENDPDNDGILDIDMSKASQNVTLKINKDKLRELNPFGLSDVTILTEGTTNSDLITLQVGLKPRVELSLKNGTDATHFKATSAVSTLDVEARLVEGYLNENVTLKVTPETLSSTLSLGNGTLLLNNDATVGGLQKGRSPQGDYAQGWNLVGNPYLTDINLTKVQNYGDIKGKVTHFVYHALDGSDNIIAFDMTDYDADENISPFQSYYVQALTDETDFTVTSIAKEKTLNRKTFDYYTANEVRNVQLKLLDSSGKEVDRTAIRWDDQSNDEYMLNEDAPKVVAANAGNSTTLYTMSSDARPLSINVMPNKSKQLIKVGMDVASPGDYTLHVSRLSGFDGTDNNLYLVDFGKGEVHTLLSEGLDYPFTLDDEGQLEDRFLIVPTLNGDVMTDNDDLLAAGTDESGYRVYTDKRSLTVTGLQGDAQVNVYDMSGMLLIRVETGEPAYTTDIDSGFYLVRIRENDKDYVVKVVVK